MEYRNELKFEVSELELTKIRGRLLPFMRLDSHQNINGYTIKSLYFDDIYDSCMREKENGISFREKYRIRTYNNETKLIRLEKKIKYLEMTKKVSQNLTTKDCEFILANDKEYFWDILSRNRGTLLEEFALKVLRQGFTPKCIVEYERFAFTENIGNVRITFDRNISGSRYVENYWDSDIPLVPVMPSMRHILEVKYDEMLPRHILQALDLGYLHRLSFSKYYITRAIIG